jgi:hypothetical protein
MLSIVGRDHVITRCTLVASDHRVPFGWTVRLLVFAQRDGLVLPYWSLFDYFVGKWPKSDAWQVSVARALGLFWDYTIAYLPSEDPSQPIDWRHRELFRGFGAALSNGTIRGSADPLGLFWMAQSVETTKRVIYAIDQFFAWKANESGGPNPYGASARETTIEDRMAKAVSSAIHQKKNLLGHLGQRYARIPSVVALPALGRQDSSISGPLSFPPKWVEEVLWTGFRRRGASLKGFEQYDLRSMMIFLLQCFAGLREHEPFHLWINDVGADPLNSGRATVFLYHPSEGLAYFDSAAGGLVRTTRKEKLEKEYGLPPRTHGRGAYRIGWKKSKVETKDNYAILYWTDPTAAVLFLILFRAYVARRAVIMERRRALGYGDHPFLFVSERENRNDFDGARFFGAPAPIGSYESALERAVTRCGLPYGKEYGTTTHGLRHLYAYTMEKLKVPKKILQEGLRHRHPNSSDRYGLPTPQDINDELNRANIANPDLTPVRLTRSLKWIEDKFPEYRRTPL